MAAGRMLCGRGGVTTEHREAIKLNVCMHPVILWRASACSPVPARQCMLASACAPVPLRLLARAMPRLRGPRREGGALGLA